jgi:hypothetical protein
MASIMRAEPFRAGVIKSIGCEHIERIEHVTVMQGLLNLHRLRSRQVCKPMQIVLPLARRPQRRRRQSASQRQQQVPTDICLRVEICRAPGTDADSTGGC